ncbi:MAG: Lrp/AsnC family transcriptional regulator [Promethearchaeota archaeon]|nr:MAG: Lrp/AsnC family transcriptional regulator [Candidatus Lokiarchaeota archaeon]
MINKKFEKKSKIYMNDQNELDKLDWKILIELSKDARLSFRSLSETLNKSPVTIKRHIESLEDKGIIKDYGVTIDYEKLGLDIIAVIELTISKGKMLEVETDIAKNPNVFGVYDITGEYDALIFARFKAREDLSKLVKDVNSYDYVIRTNTHLILNIIKQETSSLTILEDKLKEFND